MSDNITVELSPAEVAVIAAAFDRWPTITDPPPPAFFEVESKLQKALGANLEAQKAFEDMRK
jgi:hypothetical protein